MPNYEPNATSFTRALNNHDELERITGIVSQYFGVNVEVLKSRTRRREVLYPRQIIMTLAYDAGDLTLKYIGEYFNRDHSTVVNAVQQVSDLRETNKRFNKKCEELEKIINPIRYNWIVNK